MDELGNSHGVSGTEVEVAGAGDSLDSTVHAQLLVGTLSSFLRRTRGIDNLPAIARSWELAWCE